MGTVLMTSFLHSETAKKIVVENDSMRQFLTNYFQCNLNTTPLSSAKTQSQININSGMISVHATSKMLSI